MKDNKVRYITEVGFLSAVAALLMLFDIPLWFAPSFYKIDISELAVMIGGFALGPLASVIIEAIKLLIHLMIRGTSTFFVGEAANFIIGCSFVLPAAVIYKRRKTKKSAMLGMISGTLIMATVGSAMNAFVLIPAYVEIYQLPLEQIISMGNAVNKYVNSLGTLVFFAVVPFNLIKGIIVSFLTALLYKRISPLLKNKGVVKTAR